MREEVYITTEEAVRLGAADGLFFCRYFFPHLFRQESPTFHRWLWDLYSKNRFSNAEIFRGGAKTTMLRLVFAHRISYGLLYTGLFIGKSEGSASESVIWIEREIETNKLWTETFGLSKGKIWNQTECEIIHGVEGRDLRLLAMGMFGSVRGINIVGRRPDTIGVDDPLDEENSATPEQITKGNELFFTAVKESLVPESEDPTARLMLAQTPFNSEDISAMCTKSDEFASLNVGILTDMEDIEGSESSWPARWTKEEIIKDRNSAIQRNQLHLWMREKGCKIVSKATAEFRVEWLKIYKFVPPGSVYVGAIDPAPIRSDLAVMKGIQTDLQAVMVCAYWRGMKYIVEYGTARDQDPEELARLLNRLAYKYPIRAWGVETVAYQRTLKWYLEREMQQGRLKHLRIVEIPAGKAKHERIVQAHQGRASSGSLFIKEEHTEFRSDFEMYPNIKFKDRLDVSAMCDMTITPRQENEAIEGEYMAIDESHIPDLQIEGGCP